MRGGLLVGAYHLAPIFWVELAGEECRVDEITEHHRELAPFGIGCATLSRRKCGLGNWGRGCESVSPAQTRILPFSSRQLLGLDQFDLEVFEVGIV